MKQSVRDEWTAALRSDEWKQGRGQLCNEDGEMCCLGVLYDVAIDGDWVLSNGRWTADGNSTRLSDDLRKQLGLNVGTQHMLVRQNDSGYSFREIADWIDANIPVEPD